MCKPASPSEDSDQIQSSSSHDSDDGSVILGDDQPLLYDSEDYNSDSDSDYTPDTDTSSGTMRENLVFAPRKDNGDQGGEAFLDSRLDADPKLLEAHIRQRAATPPRFFVRLVGKHNQAGDDLKPVTDFDVSIDLSSYLFSDTNHAPWYKLRTPYNGDQVKRGTSYPCRAPGYNLGQDPDAKKPTLAEWCRRFCASNIRFRALDFSREVVGFDWEGVEGRLRALVQKTNYRGHVHINIYRGNISSVYNNCALSRQHLDMAWAEDRSFFFALAVILVLAFIRTAGLTKRFKVATATWSFSKVGPNGRRRYVSISEDQWFDTWKDIIYYAVLARRQGVTLGKQDLLAADAVASDSTVGNLKAGMDAVAEADRRLGWGLGWGY